MFHGNIYFSFVHAGNCIGIFFGKMAPVTAIMDEIYSLFSVMDNSLLHASVHYPADKIEERIPFRLDPCTFIFS